MKIIYILTLSFLTFGAFAQNQYEVAINYCNDQLVSDPNNAILYRTRADAKRANGDNAGARLDYQKVVQLNNTSTVDDSTLADSYYGLGEINRQAGLYQVAANNYNNAISVNDNHGNAYMGLAIAENARGGRNTQACTAIQAAEERGAQVGDRVEQFCP